MQCLYVHAADVFAYQHLNAYARRSACQTATEKFLFPLKAWKKGGGGEAVQSQEPHSSAVLASNVEDIDISINVSINILNSSGNTVLRSSVSLYL